jgi:hypothetical protein
MMRHATWIVAAVAAMLWSSTALADAAPFDDDDDDSAATCSLIELEFSGMQCEACNPDECEERFTGTQFEYECTNYEGDTELEIWCEEQESTLVFCALLQQGNTPTIALTFTMAAIGLVALFAGRRR